MQTFRVQWICHILAVFILVWQCHQIYVSKIQKGIGLDFWKKAFLVSLLVLWIDCAYIIPIILLLLLHATKPQKIKTIDIVLLVVGLCCAFLSIYQALGIKHCIKPEYVYASKVLFIGPLFTFVSIATLYFCMSFPKAAADCRTFADCTVFRYYASIDCFAERENRHGICSGNARLYNNLFAMEYSTC